MLARYYVNIFVVASFNEVIESSLFRIDLFIVSVYLLPRASIEIIARWFTPISPSNLASKTQLVFLVSDLLFAEYLLNYFLVLATAPTVTRLSFVSILAFLSLNSFFSATSCRHLSFWSLSSRVPTSQVSISSSKSQKHDKPANGRFRISQKFVIVNPRERSVLLHCLHTTAMAVALWRCEVSCQERLSESLFFLHCCLTPFCWARAH